MSGTDQQNLSDTFLIRSILYNNLTFEIACFFAAHPRGRLSLYTIANALDTARINIREGMRGLVEQGIIKEMDSGPYLVYSIEMESFHTAVQQARDNKEKLKAEFEGEEKILARGSIENFIERTYYI